MDKKNTRFRKMYDAHTDFESWWEDIQAFAEQNRITTQYVEDEFILDGEFFAVHLEWQEDES